MTYQQMADKLEEVYGYKNVKYESSDAHAAYFDAKKENDQIVTVKIVRDEDGEIGEDPYNWQVEDKRQGHEDWYDVY